ncbi:hypothetical protein CONLIGDRAFT_694011 [Coniochaeta ligniaria NRRL 30616]|uniref:Uncharacterized protein n=1 Tax=Coniochaeta ligniaria NRRL 30616 TaxID=1408157 RepID=A0A1J7I7J1_9PEZI|nr:hypothetical protein CONLIGDRAFT_694011 [Coniochaeta ligniaria NRRL 30616]
MENSTVASRITIPPIPALRGEENLQEGKRVLLQTLEFYGTADYVLKISAGITKFSKKQSIFQVHDGLANPSWNFNATGQDPKDLYNLFLYTLSKTNAAVSDFVHEFAKVKPSISSSFEAYHAHIEELKRRLAEVDCAVPDKFAIWIVLNALKDYHPE